MIRDHPPDFPPYSSSSQNLRVTPNFQRNARLYLRSVLGGFCENLGHRTQIFESSPVIRTTHHYTPSPTLPKLTSIMATPTQTITTANMSSFLQDKLSKVKTTPLENIPN